MLYKLNRRFNMLHYKEYESDIQKICIKYLQMNGWFIIPNWKNKRPRVRGVSDITAIKRGRHLWIEFKRIGNDQSDEQIQFQRAIKNHGAEYLIIRSLDDLMYYLNDYKQEELDFDYNNMSDLL